MTLSPTASLRNSKAFRQVYQEGRHVADPLFVVYALKQNAPGEARLGLSVSKKVGNAVARNRIKRLVKESCRLHPLPAGHDYVVVARKGSAEALRAISFAKVDAILTKLRTRLGTGHPPAPLQ